MKRNIGVRLGLAAILGGGLLAGCAETSRFEWGSYDAALYAYSKKPEELPRYEAALKEAIEKGRASNRLAPGLQAELGYCYLVAGDKAGAVQMFKAEMADFPESRPFLSKIVAQSGG